MTTKTQRNKVGFLFLMIALSLGVLLTLFYIPKLTPFHPPMTPSSHHEISSLEEARFLYEKQLRQSIEGLLTPWLGNETAQVSVHAEIDFTQNQKTQEILDVNNPAIQRAEGENVEYAYSKQTIQTDQKSGNVKRLSIAVLLDTRKNSFSSEQLNEIRHVIEHATGLDETRGDTLEIVQTPFAPISIFSTAVWSPSLMIFFIIFLFVIFGVVMMKNGEVAEQMEPMPSVLPAFTQPSIVNSITNPIEGDITPNTFKKAQKLLKKNPDETLSVLRGWLCQSEGGVHEP